MSGRRNPKSVYLVFISHSARDQWVARQMARAIEGQGKPYKVRSFLDEKDVESGDHIHESIRDSIRDCDEFMVLLTRRSASRAWVLIEMGAACSRGDGRRDTGRVAGYNLSV